MNVLEENPGFVQAKMKQKGVADCQKALQSESGKSFRRLWVICSAFLLSVYVANNLEKKTQFWALEKFSLQGVYECPAKADHLSFGDVFGDLDEQMKMPKSKSMWTG
jgi:hypothetical protein